MSVKHRSKSDPATVGMTGHLLSRAGLWVLKILLVLPLCSLIYLSLQSSWRFPALLQAPDWRHWSQTLGGQNALLDSLLLSFGLSASVAALAGLSGFGASALVSGSSSRRWLSASYFPYLIAPVIFAAMLQYYFVRAGLSGSLRGVVLAQLLFVFPYAVLFYSGFWTPRVRKLMAQARTLGAGRAAVLRRILWPMSRPWIAMGLYQCFLLSWFEYGLTRLIGVGKVPTLTIQTLYYVQEGNPHLAAVASLLMVLPTTALLLLNRQVLFRRLDAADLKA